MTSTPKVTALHVMRIFFDKSLQVFHIPHAKTCTRKKHACQSTHTNNLDLTCSVTCEGKKTTSQSAR